MHTCHKLKHISWDILYSIPNLPREDTMKKWIGVKCQMFSSLSNQVKIKQLLCSILQIFCRCVIHINISLIFIYTEASLHCFGITTLLNIGLSYSCLHFKFLFLLRENNNQFQISISGQSPQYDGDDFSKESGGTPEGKKVVFSFGTYIPRRTSLLRMTQVQFICVSLQMSSHV